MLGLSITNPASCLKFAQNKQLFLFLCHTESYVYPSLLLLQFSGHLQVKALLLVTNSYAFAEQWQSY